jgi:hypothetical protein
MPLGWLFWMLYIIAVLFGGWLYYDGQPAWPRRFGGYMMLWILVGILGYHVFGSVIK